jgi:hypothetical protein
MRTAQWHAAMLLDAVSTGVGSLYTLLLDVISNDKYRRPFPKGFRDVKVMFACRVGLCNVAAADPFGDKLPC